jgi:hypothetical protein
MHYLVSCHSSSSAPTLAHDVFSFVSLVFAPFRPFLLSYLLFLLFSGPPWWIFELWKKKKGKNRKGKKGKAKRSLRREAMKLWNGDAASTLTTVPATHRTRTDNTCTTHCTQLQTANRTPRTLRIHADNTLTDTDNAPMRYNTHTDDRMTTHPQHTVPTLHLTTPPQHTVHTLNALLPRWQPLASFTHRLSLALTTYPQLIASNTPAHIRKITNVQCNAISKYTV